MNTKTEEFCKVSITHTFDRQTVEDLLITVFEGGSILWIVSVSRVMVMEGESIYDAAFNHGLGIQLIDEPFKVLLDKESMQRGMQVLFDRYRHHGREILDDNANAVTADVWLQCCLFLEIRYC